MKSIEVTGKLWFDRQNGNTYCKSEISIDGKLWGETGFQYGYGDFYMQAAGEMLNRRKGWHIKNTETLSAYCRRRGIALYYHSKYYPKKEVTGEEKVY